ncbi:MAG TPA: DUF3221 domain-containing protein [Paenibacillus cookii]|nr:DUF3221 domain-containing protein [Paenibacillus cookii]
MRIKYFIMFQLLLIFISGCSNSESDTEKGDFINTTFSGYIVKKEIGRVLVTNYIADSENKSEAIWVITSMELDIGDRISVEFDGGLETSNPAQGKAKKIGITHDEQQNEKSKKEAIVKAINECKDMDVPVIKTIDYNITENKWVVVLFDSKKNFEEKEITIDLNHN